MPSLVFTRIHNFEMEKKNQNTKICPTTENASIYRNIYKLLKFLFTFLEHMKIKNEYVYVNVQLF